MAARRRSAGSIRLWATLSLFGLLIAAVPVAASRQDPSGAQAVGDVQAVAITNVTVIDANGVAAQPDMTVVVREDRIAVLGASREVPVPREATVVDGAGKFLIPGLWDMHVHTYDQSWRRRATARSVPSPCSPALPGTKPGRCPP
jgi:hypothetical protein